MTDDEVAELLARTSAVLATSLDKNEILQLLAAVPVPKLADWCFVDVVQEDGWLDRVAVTHADPRRAELAASFRRRFAPRPDIAHGVSLAVAAQRPQLVADIDDGVLVAIARDEPHLASLRALQLRSYVCAPVVVRGRPFGVFSFGSTGHAYTPRDLALAEELARRAATVIDKALLYEDTRSLVRQLENIQLVTAELSRARDEGEIAATIVRRGSEAVGAAACLLWTLNDDGSLDLLDGQGVPGLDSGNWHHLEPDAQFPVFRTLVTDQPMWVETEDDYQREAPELYASQKARGRILAFAALPLSVDARPAGVLSFSFPLGRRFSDSERRCLLTLKQQCEQALHRVRLFAREAALRAQAEEAQSRAEAANRAKDEFLAMLGHELRNPLAPIVTALEILRIRQGEPSREVQVIQRQVSHLTRLVDDLLDVSRIARGKIELRLERVSLGAVVAKALEIVSPLLEQRRHQLAVDVPSTGLELHADPLRLAQVVANLLSNSARYTETGGKIEVSGHAEGAEIVLRVRDNGAGIERELLPQVFELFVQGHRKLDRSEGGLGLGLAIVKNLVKLHDGTVTATSEGRGTGSTFVVRLPALSSQELAAAHAAAEESHQGRTRQKKRVLVVDDNADAAATVADLLEMAGHEVRVAHDGVGALRCLGEFRPNVALVDIGLPVMDGYELGERLRRELPLRLVALTGYGTDHDRARSAQAGFDAHFVKPVTPDELLRFVDETKI